MAKTRSAERAEFLNGIVNTAAEGGVQSWAFTRNYKKTDRGDGIERYSIEVQEMEGDLRGDPWELIDEDVVSTGLNRWLKDPDARADDKRRLREASKENDAGNIDAIDASNIVEYGLFGEIVYS